ncbi:hypothetical protein ACET3Z_019283 [Daucus carota]
MIQELLKNPEAAMLRFNKLRAVLQFSDLAVLLTSPISLLWALRVPLATLDALGQRRIAFVKCFKSNKRSKTN